MEYSLFVVLIFLFRLALASIISAERSTKGKRMLYSTLVVETSFNQGGRIITFGNKLLLFGCKSEIFYVCYDATKSCYYFTSIGKHIYFNGRVKRNILKYTEQQLYIKFNYGAMPINKKNLGMVDRRSVFV